MLKTLKYLYLVNKKTLVLFFVATTVLFLFMLSKDLKEIKFMLFMAIIPFLNIFVVLFIMIKEFPYWKSHVSHLYFLPVKYKDLGITIVLLLYNVTLFIFANIALSSKGIVDVVVCIIVSFFAALSIYQTRYLVVFSRLPVKVAFTINITIYCVVGAVFFEKISIFYLLITYTICFLLLIFAGAISKVFFDYYGTLYALILKKGEIHNPILDKLFDIND